MTRIILLLLALMPGTVLALSGDRDQPIHIEADSLDIDETAGISTYQGNVRYTQGTIVMNADTIIVHSRDGQLYKFEAFGNPAHYQQQLEKDGDLSAKAKSMEYVSDTEKLVLKDSVHVVKGENEFTGNIVEYNTKDEIVSARKAESGGERVQVIIQPRKQADEAGTK